MTISVSDFGDRAKVLGQLLAYQSRWMSVSLDTLCHVTCVRQVGGFSCRVRDCVLHSCIIRCLCKVYIQWSLSFEQVVTIHCLAALDLRTITILAEYATPKTTRIVYLEKRKYQ